MTSSAALDAVPLPMRADGCLGFLWPALGAFPIPAEQRRELEAAAGSLAPVPRIGLELRLGGRGGSVDLHQLVLKSSDDISALRHVMGKAPGSYPAGLLSFLDTWVEADTPLSRYVDRVFFEWDSSGADTLRPAIFLPIDPKHAAQLGPQDRSDILRALISLSTGDSENAETNAVPESIWNAASGGITISHIGAMTGRGGLLRINYRRVPEGGLAELLTALCWPGNIGEAARRFDDAVGIADIVTIGIDLRDQKVQPSLGMEIFFDEQPGWEPRWKILLQRLCSVGLCEESEIDCLLHVHANIYPFTPGQRWPSCWIAATQIAAPDASPRVERKLSHVKLSLDASANWTAKAYVTAQHFWSAEQVPSLPPQPRGLEEARSAAMEFLLRSRSQNGWWAEFRTLRGPSDEWATAFVGWCLAATRDPRALAEAASAAKLLLSRERPGGGWGYSAESPPDADTTAWVLRLFRSTGYRGPAEERGRHFLLKHTLPSGGIATYEPGAVLQFGDLPPLRDDRGWKQDHICVAANAAPFLSKSFLGILAEQQNADGSWTPYWWRTPALATALAAEALGEEAAFSPRVQLAVRWAHAWAPADGSAFTEAWRIVLLGLGTGSDRSYARERIASLVQKQLEDGSWPCGADLKIPESDDLQGDAAPDMEYESRRLFTTAAVLMAMSAPLLPGPTSQAGPT